MRGELACSGRALGSGRTRGGCITVEQPSLLGELTADEEMSLMRSELPPVSVPSHSLEHQRVLRTSLSASTDLESRSRRSADWQSHFFSRCHTCLRDRQSQSSSDDWLGPRACRKLQEKSEPDFRCTKQVYEDLLHSEKQNTENIHQFMMETEILNLRRREMLHRKWTENVYEPIRCKIMATVSPTIQDACREQGRVVGCSQSRASRPDSASSRVQAYNDFLYCLNRKGTVFLDVCDPCEYCPLPPNTCVTTGHLNDPLLAQGRTELDEDAIALSCITGSVHSRKDIEQQRLFPSVNPCGTSWKQYLEMPLGDIDSPVRIASRNRMYGNRNNSTIPWIDPSLNHEVSHRYIHIRRAKSTPLVS